MGVEKSEGLVAEIFVNRLTVGDDIVAKVRALMRGTQLKRMGALS